MPGLHAQLTSTELTSALDATGTLLKLEPYIDRLTYTKISTLHTDLAAEQALRASGRIRPAAPAGPCAPGTSTAQPGTVRAPVPAILDLTVFALAIYAGPSPAAITARL